MSKLASFVRHHGWVPEGSDPLGLYEGVAFTVEEAEMTLSVANTGTEFQLDHEVGLDSPVVQRLVAARPLYAMEQLANVPQIGPSALTSLRDYAVRYLQNDQNDGSFVLTPSLAEYYADVMGTVLRDDREFFEELLAIAANVDEADRILQWMEVELEHEIRSRVGQVFPSEQDLLEELYGVLERLQERAAELLLN